MLWHIHEALRRLYRSPETFGRCDECGRKIAFERLDAISYVPRCVRCKQDWETVGRPSGEPRGHRPRVYSLANAASKATCDGAKSVALIFAHASRAPNSRSMPPSSHSIDSGPL